MAESISARLARSLRQLREARGLTQQQIAKLSGIPRATWGHLETGGGNPTLAVLDRVATALQVPIEELTAAPRPSARVYPKRALAHRMQRNGMSHTLYHEPITRM